MKDYINSNPEFKQYGETRIRWYNTNGFMSTLMLAGVIIGVLCTHW